MQGSVIPRIKCRLAVTVLLASLIAFTHGTLFRLKITMTPIPFTLIRAPRIAGRSWCVGSSRLPTSMCRTVERDLLAALGESELPEPLKPVDYVIL
jgi:predicted membrane chloride channel (bestrophin family)